MSTFINPPPFLAQPAFSRKICFSASSCLCSLLTSHSNGPQIKMHFFLLCSSFLEIRNGCWPFIDFVLGSSFKWKIRSNLNVHLILFIIFWTHCFFINPLDASILRDTNMFFQYGWLWFFNRANIYSIEASFLERYFWASTAAFLNSWAINHIIYPIISQQPWRATQSWFLLQVREHEILSKLGKNKCENVSILSTGP